MNLEKIKEDKIKEAEEIYRQIGLSEILETHRRSQYSTSTPDISTENKKNTNSAFHWTRLSNTSSIGHIVE